MRIHVCSARRTQSAAHPMSQQTWGRVRGRARARVRARDRARVRVGVRARVRVGVRARVRARARVRVRATVWVRVRVSFSTLPSYSLTPATLERSMLRVTRSW